MFGKWIDDNWDHAIILSGKDNDVEIQVPEDCGKKYYMKEATNGGKSDKACLTDEEVIQCRKRYVTETAKEIYKDYQERISYQTFQQMLWGRTYSNLPVYKKKQGIWINK